MLFLDFSNINVKVYLHSKNQFLDFPGRVGHKVYVGDKVQTEITYQDVTQLEKLKTPKRNENGENEMKTCSHLNYDQCMYNVLANIMRNETKGNCTTPFIMDNDNICTKREDIKASFFIALRRTTNQQRDCDTPCHSVFVSIGGKNVKKYKTRKYGEITAVFRPRVYKIEEHNLYTFINFLAEVGKEIMCKKSILADDIYIYT